MSSKPTLDWEDVGDDDAPSLDTEEGRDSWIEFLLSQDGTDDEQWAKAMVVREDDDMVIRFQWDDGREEIYDVVVRRSMEVVAAKDEAGTN